MKLRQNKAANLCQHDIQVRIQVEGLKTDIRQLKQGQEAIIHRLDHVSANGNPGFEASLKDIYDKLKELHIDVVNARELEANRWYNMSLNELFVKTWMKPIWIVIIILVLNSIGHQFGFGLDIQSILKSFGN